RSSETMMRFDIVEFGLERRNGVTRSPAEILSLLTKESIEGVGLPYSAGMPRVTARRAQLRQNRTARPSAGQGAVDRCPQLVHPGDEPGRLLAGRKVPPLATLKGEQAIHVIRRNRLETASPRHPVRLPWPNE